MNEKQVGGMGKLDRTRGEKFQTETKSRNLDCSLWSREEWGGGGDREKGKKRNGETKLSFALSSRLGKSCSWKESSRSRSREVVEARRRSWW